jgi:Kelch motif protein
MKRTLLLALIAGWTLTALAQDMPLRETTPLSGGLQYFNSAQLPDGDVIVYGGTATFPNPTTATWRYDWETETWSQLGNMAFAAAQMASTTLSNGNILCVGGTNDFAGKVQKSQLFDVNTLTWTESAGNFEFFNPIYSFHSVLTLPGDYVLLTTSNGDFSVYDPATTTWSNQASPGPLDGGGARMVWLDTQQEVLWTWAGGQIFQPGNPPTSGNLFYLDPPQELYNSGVVKLLDGSVLTMDLEFSFDNEVTRYDPVTRTADSITTVPFNGGAASRSAILIPDGRIVTFGFGNITTPGDTKVVQVYDPATNTWETGTYTEMGPLGSPQMHVFPDSSIFAISTVPVNSPEGTINECWIINRDDAVPAGEVVKDVQVEIFPNPASGWLQIKGLENRDASLTLYSPDGTKAAHWNATKEKMSLTALQLPGGLYFYSVHSPDGEPLSAGKVIIQ